MYKQARAPVKDHRGRHKMLKAGSSYYCIWQYVKGHPGVTSPEIQKVCQINHQRIYDMVSEGLLEARGETNKRGFWIRPENSIGLSRDKLKITLQIFKNDFGEYSINAKLHGEMHGASDEDTNPKLLSTRGVMVVVPKKSEVIFSEEVLQTSAPVSTTDIKLSRALTIEGKYTILEED